MKYGLLLLNEDINSSQLQILGNKKFSITINSECQLNKNDKVLGYLINSSKKIVLEYLVTENSSSTKLSLSKICEIAEGVTIENIELLSVINKAKSLNQNLVELNEKDFANYEQKLFSLIGIGKSKVITSVKPLPFPHNRIIFGAPGTGKSFQLKKEQEEYFDEKHFERVTFHPNYSYAQFVGTYKPSMKKNNSSVFDSDKKWILEVLTDKNKTAQEKYDVLFDKFKGDGLTRLPILLGLYSDDDFKTRKQDGTPAVGDNSVERNHGKAIRPYVSLYNDNSSSEEITYEYTPGSFVRVLEKALKSQQEDKNENFLLIIEEINRANVAAVFGDVFQLLDRDSDGNSEYEIDANKDLEKYLNDNGITLNNHKLKIPNNMYIWATMNSADQGVMPLDAAFKRRWNFEYLNIDANENGVKNIDIPNIKNGDDGYNCVKWNLFRKALNDKLKKEPSLNVNEDKLLGPFFISLKDLQNAKTEPEKFIDLFKSKVLMYLFEDVCKMNPKALFTGIDIDGRIHYSDVCEQFDKKGVGIFGFDTEELNKTE